MSSPFSTVSPADGSPLPPVSPTAETAVAAIVAKARGAQPAWGALSVDDRVRAVSVVKDRILGRAEEVAKLIHLEVGKPETEALLAEVLATADVVEHWGRAIGDLVAPREISIDPISYPGKRGVIHTEARGVVGVIMPWNFPVALPFRTIIPALLAGNTVVFKPSEVSPRCGALIAELFAGLPAGVFSVVQGGGNVGAALCRADVDTVSFTGSVATGKRVALACAERLIPCSLELGGKDAAIVLADVNLERAAHGILWGALGNAGQNCAAIERVYVERAVADAFTKRVVELAKGLRSGDDLGPLTTPVQRDIVARHVEEAKQSGAVILTGGESGSGRFAYPATVLKVTNEETPLIQDETFGPVLPIVVVEGADEAIARANHSRFGLTASIWTRDLKRGAKLAKQLRAGVVTINNHSFTGALPGAPWSGFGESGYGITNSDLSLHALTRPRFILVDSSGGSRELWWYPYTPALRAIALGMATLRNGKASIGAKLSALLSLLKSFPKRLFGKD